VRRAHPRAGALTLVSKDFAATRWRATANVPERDPASATTALVVEADSLRNRQTNLFEENRRNVDPQAAGLGVLDAASGSRATEFTDRATAAAPGAPRR
jgi:hypothetical protein